MKWLEQYVFDVYCSGCCMLLVMLMVMLLVLLLLLLFSYIINQSIIWFCLSTFIFMFDFIYSSLVPPSSSSSYSGYFIWQEQFSPGGLFINIFYNVIISIISQANNASTSNIVCWHKYHSILVCGVECLFLYKKKEILNRFRFSLCFYIW